MPQNRHFWQGLNVRWSGQIVDVNDLQHGGGIFFIDLDCAVEVRLASDVVPQLFSSSNPVGHLAVAEFIVEGRLSYQDGEVVLRPQSLRRTSSWKTDENAISFLEEALRKREAK